MVRYEVYSGEDDLVDWRDCQSATEARSRLLVMGFLPTDPSQLTWSKGDALTAVIVPTID
jgi:hypothetical protein